MYGVTRRPFGGVRLQGRRHLVSTGNYLPTMESGVIIEGSIQFDSPQSKEFSVCSRSDGKASIQARSAICLRKTRCLVLTQRLVIPGDSSSVVASIARNQILVFIFLCAERRVLTPFERRNFLNVANDPPLLRRACVSLPELLHS